jgi:aminoglycoside phosphotransferase (APT) family kinase protein
MSAMSGEARAIDALVKEIPFIKDCRDIVKIDKGFSLDEKYKIRMPAEQATVLLRLFSAQELAQKKLEYAVMEQMQQLGIRCSEPLAIGKAGDKGYMITSYLEGEDAEYALPLYSPEEQFEVGFEAGRELRNMHQYEAPAEMSSWAVRKTAKHRKYLAAYANCGIKIRNDQKVIDFIEERIHLMDGRPNLFQHDDYHPGNLIVKGGRFAGVVDFGRHDWGDPFHEFLKVGLFSRG